MDASNSSMDFTVEKLAKSIHQEDKELAERTRIIIDKIVESVKPLFRYIGTDVCYHQATDFSDCERNAFMYKQMRMIQISQTRQEWPYSLFLAEDGTWHTMFFCPYMPDHGKHYQMGHTYNSVMPITAWEFFPFNEVIDGLRNILKEAEEKREKHLVAIRERSQKLDEIMAILERSPAKDFPSRASQLNISTK